MKPQAAHTPRPAITMMRMTSSSTDSPPWVPFPVRGGKAAQWSLLPVRGCAHRERERASVKAPDVRSGASGHPAQGGRTGRQEAVRGSRTTTAVSVDLRVA
jgi:hypothetical protein